MKRWIFMLGLILLLAGNSWGTAIVQTTDYLSFPVCALDSATGVPMVPESTHVHVWRGSLTNATVYSNREAADGADPAQIDSVQYGAAVPPQYYFHDQVQDIDGDGTAGVYTVNVRMWRGYTPTDNWFSFQVVDSSFNTMLTRIGDVNERFDSTDNALVDANKANFKATGFATTSECDSIEAAIADANKPNFKATGFATSSEGDSIIAAISDANKANFKATGFAVSGDPMTLQSDSLYTLMTDVDAIKAKTDTLNFQGVAGGLALAVDMTRVDGDTSAAKNLERAFDGDSTTWAWKLQLRQLQVIADAGNNTAMYLSGLGSGHGTYSLGGATGYGGYFKAGATGTYGFYAEASNAASIGFGAFGTGTGISATGTNKGIYASGVDAFHVAGSEYGILANASGDGGAGMMVSGSGTSDGLLLSAAGTGYDINLAGDGTIHGTIDSCAGPAYAGQVMDTINAHAPHGDNWSGATASNWSDAQRDSILNTVEDANKANYKATGFATTTIADSINNAIVDANKANFKATGFATTSECDSIEAAIADANKPNFKADIDSINNAVADANKVNFKATGFATDSDGDSVIQAISDANKPNFKATGFATSTQGDSVTNAITDVNKANFKFGGSDSVQAYLATEDEGKLIWIWTSMWDSLATVDDTLTLLIAFRDSINNAIADANKANFKASGFAVSGDPMTLQSDSLKTLMGDVDSIVVAIADANKVNFKADVDSVNNAVADANKVNFKADVDSMNNAVADANKANFKATGFATTSECDSIEAAIADANKVNFKADVDSVNNAIVDANKANFKATGFATTSECDSIEAAIADANKPNFKATGFATSTQGDSITLAITDVNKANFKYSGGADSVRAYLATHDSTLLEVAAGGASNWSDAQRDSVLNTIEDANKANYKATGFATSAQGDSVTQAISNVNKANFKATGFATTSECDSIEAAIADANKANFMADVDSVNNAVADANKTNFKASGFATSAQGDSVTQAISDDNKANFKATGFATSSEGDSIIAAISDANKANFKATGFATAESVHTAITDANKANFKLNDFSTVQGFVIPADTTVSGDMIAVSTDFDSIEIAITDANKANFKATGFATTSECDSVEAAIADANKVNFKATGFATSADGDSVTQAISDVNKANFKYTGGADSVRAYLATHDSTLLEVAAGGVSNWSNAQRDSVLNTIEDANKANYKATGFATSAQGDSVVQAISDVNKANFKATGFATTTIADSVNSAISDVNKANFIATGFATSADGDSVTNAIADANKTNFKYAGGADSVRAYLATHDSTLLEAAVATCAAGTGSDTLDIIVFDGDTTAVEGVDLCIYNPTKTAKAVPSITTDVNGYCQVWLDPGSYPTICQRLGVILTEWDTVTVPSGGGRDTIWVVAQDAGSPPSGDLTQVKGYIRGMTGGQYGKGWIAFAYHEPNVMDTSASPAVYVDPTPIVVQVDTGAFVVNLKPSINLLSIVQDGPDKDSVTYDVTIWTKQHKIFNRFNVFIPDSSGAVWLEDLID